MLIPDSAHGTNAASCTLAGYEVVPHRERRDGVIAPATVAAALDTHGTEVAALMMTNPNTLGIFERHVKEIADLVHAKGALLYCDGANLSALLGMARPGDMGYDVMQFNLHKTFATPHGGGGPGCGPVGVVGAAGAVSCPRPPSKRGDGFALDFDRPKSIGRLRTFWGNFGMWVRAYALIREWGPEGVQRAGQLAVLNANYLRKLLEPPLPPALQGRHASRGGLLRQAAEGARGRRAATSPSGSSTTASILRPSTSPSWSRGP